MTNTTSNIPLNCQQCNHSIQEHRFYGCTHEEDGLICDCGLSLAEINKNSKENEANELAVAQARIGRLEAALTKINRTLWQAFKDPVAEIKDIATEALKETL